MSRHWLGLLLLLLGVWLRGGVAHAALMVADNPLDIGTVVVSQSRTGTTTLTASVNTANVTVVRRGGDQCGEFSIEAPTGMITINTGNAATVMVRFTPTSSGAKSCVIDVKQGTAVVTSFTATGTATGGPAIRIDVSPTFTATEVGKSSSAQLTLTNTGTSPLTITSATPTGGTEFTVTSGLGATLAVGAQTTYDLTCSPATFGTRTDTFRIVSDASNDSPKNIALSCNGLQGVLKTDQDTMIPFRAVARGTIQTRTFQLTNIGNVDVTNIAIAVVPVNVGYSVDPPTLAALAANGDSAAITVSFKPMSKTDGGPAKIVVTGKWGSTTTPTPDLSLNVDGIEASFGLTPAQPAFDFGRFRYDTHPRQEFDLFNDGNAILTMAAPFTPDAGTGATEYNVVFASGTLTVPPPVTLGANPAQHVTVVVSPQVTKHIGVVSGHIDVTPSVGAPLRVPITGVATAAEVEFPDTVSFGVIDLNAPPPTQTIAIKNTSDSPLDITSITASVPGDSGSSTGAFAIRLPSTPTRLAPGASLSFQVTYQPTVATTGTSGASGTDRVNVDAQLAGALDIGLRIQITGEAVFNEIHGGGGCDAGTGSAGGLVLALAALIATWRRRRRAIVAAASLAVALAALIATRWRCRRAARRSIALAAIAAATLALAPVVRADGIGLTVFAPTPATTGEGLALQVPDVGAPGRWVANAVVSYASNLLLIDSVSVDGSRVTHALVGTSTLLQLGAAYALLDRFELGARVPLYRQSGDAASMGQAAHGTALGDLALHAKARLWRGDTRAGALVAGASAIALLPTASKDQFTGSDQPEARLLVLGSFRPGALGARLALALNAGAVLRGTSRYGNIEQRSAFAWAAGASIHIVPRLWATAELFGELMPSARHPEPVAGAMPSPAAVSQVEGLAGVRIEVERRVTVGLALGRGMTRAPGTPDLRGVLSLSVGPDAARSEPIRPQVLPPQDVDTDGDGIVDRLDRCPREPEDKDGFQDTDGCPDPDNDGDGILDAGDRCPDQPEDKDGFQDTDGCPDPDNDGDGIPDASDRCPGEPETVNGFQDADGCPDSLPAVDPAAATKAAEATYAKGRALMAQSHHAAACAAFEESQRLDPQFGTQFNLAICYEKLGKLATAWNLYRELARSDSNAPRRARAGQVAAGLASRVPKLRFMLPNHPAGVQVLLDGVDASALLGVEAPVDAGRHTVAVTAAGHRPWQNTVEAQDGRVVTVVIDLHPLP